MTIAETLLPEFDLEMATTRRVLERVPTDKGQWKPHPKSFSLGHLAQLVSGMPGWITNAVQETQLDLAGYPGYSYEQTEDLVKTFDRNVAHLLPSVRGDLLAKLGRDDEARAEFRRAPSLTRNHRERDLLLDRAGEVRRTVGAISPWPCASPVRGCVVARSCGVNGPVCWRLPLPPRPRD